jgi:hypothetical protein
MKKKLIIMVLIATLPLLLFSVLSLISNAKELQHDANKIGEDNVFAVRNGINNLINQNIDILKVLAQNDLLRAEKLNPDTVKSLLIASAKAHPESTTLSYIDATGQQRARNDSKPFVNLADRDYF